jgi:hypothetical protein
MSQAAQAVERAVRELRASRPTKSRRQTMDENAEAHPSSGSQTNASAPAAKKPRATKGKRAALPKLDELRLAPNGIRADERNRYINIEFTNGLVVRLFPVGYEKPDVPKVRDLLVAWMNKRLGA